MTAVTLTLTDFLAARIADDEEWARLEATTRDHRYREEHEPSHATRVLAECETKRALIDYAFQNGERIDGEWGCCHWAAQIRGSEDASCYGVQAANDLMQLLAQPYASHPDYREEWRP